MHLWITKVYGLVKKNACLSITLSSRIIFKTLTHNTLFKSLLNSSPTIQDKIWHKQFVTTRGTLPEFCFLIHQINQPNNKLTNGPKAKEFPGTMAWGIIAKMCSWPTSPWCRCIHNFKAWMKNCAQRAFWEISFKIKELTFFTDDLCLN